MSQNSSSLINKDAISVFGRSEKSFHSINGISIKIASPDDILSWSYGEVKNGETISYRTYKPERDGLMCAKIFGPIRDYECLCGKYRRIKYKGITCEKCSVEVTSSKVRRERLGHINLISPVSHILFLKGTNAIMNTVLGMTLKDLERVLYFDAHIVINPGNTTLSKRQILSESEYDEALDNFGDSFECMSGAEGILKVLSDMDLSIEIEQLKITLTSVKSDVKKRSLLKRLRVLSEFLKSKTRPEWMILTRIPVLPPDLRPMVMLDGGRFASSDLNELYRSVIDRNSRLTKMIELKAPDVIIKNEKRMLQSAVDALFDNSKKGVMAKNSDRLLKSISDSLKGKQGRFRQNLLGKRVDYSGRSVIVVGPNLKLHQCGLPKKMALELFKPFIFSKLLMYGKVSSIKVAKLMVKNESPEVWDALEEIIKEHVVMLNRAPTLHRLGIQAFEPRLIESKAIQLHPLVCKAFNADFDGDQMAVHVPLSIEAQVECRVLMISSNNILSPQDGQPTIVPTKDVMLGLYYITLPLDDAVGNGTVFDNYSDIVHAISNRSIAVNSKIIYYFGQERDQKIETTPGRVMIHKLLPQDGLISISDINIVFDNKSVGKVINKVYNIYGAKASVIFTDKMMGMGFEYSTKSGLSFGKDDMIVPETKSVHISKTFEKIKEIENQYSGGYITQREKFNQVTDYWSECTDNVARDMMKEISKNTTNSKANSIYMMMHSGARASETLMRQLAGMRGLIAKPSGEIIETPIISNFKEGLNVLEYFNSAHGTRKGVADTALKTADAGYLTRRLVDVAMDCIVSYDDCGTKNGMSCQVKNENGERLVDVAFGRILSKDVVFGDEVILAAGSVINEVNASLIEKSGVNEVFIRSVVTCEAENGVCSMCYGYDLTTKQIVNKGEAVGIIAAQSIGEPGAQLTMRTFHIGGATSKTIEKSSITSEQTGKVKMINIRTVTDKNGVQIATSNNGFIAIYNKSGIETARYPVPYSAKLFTVEDQSIEAGFKIAEWDSYNTYVVSEYTGFVKFSDMTSGLTYREKTDENLGTSQKVIIKSNASTRSMSPAILIKDENGNGLKMHHTGKDVRYLLPTNSIVSLKEGDKVEIGDLLVRIPRSGTQVMKDITGGLPRVEDIFEARSPKQAAVIAEIDGIVEFMSEYRSKSRIAIRSISDDDLLVQYSINKGEYIRVNDGHMVRKGDIIIDGDLDPHDVLAVQGVEGLAKYIIEEVQKVYKLQGAKIDNKHIEIIIRYMLRKVEIIDAGDSDFVVHQQIDRDVFRRINQQLSSSGKKEMTGKIVLQGITRASIQTESFISAASFQETTKVLTDAAISGKIDSLSGMKENIIVGRLIPSGTGYVMSNVRKAAKEINDRAHKESIE